MIEDRTLYEGKWLHFKVLKQEINGRTVNWEYVSRPPGNRGGVELVPIIDNKEIVVIANFRAPIQKFCLEFPAGIVDQQGTVEENGIRELKEETGFSGTLSQYPIQNIRYDPWKSNELGAIIVVNIDGSQPENQNPVQHLEGDENIIVYKLKLGQDLTQQIQNLAQEKNYDVSGLVWLFALGLQFRSDF